METTKKIAYTQLEPPKATLIQSLFQAVFEFLFNHNSELDGIKSPDLHFRVVWNSRETDNFLRIYQFDTGLEGWLPVTDGCMTGRDISEENSLIFLREYLFQEFKIVLP